MTPKYEEILLNIKSSFEAKTKTVVDDASDLAIRMKVFASEIHELYRQLDYLKLQVFPHTAQGDYLEKHGNSRGISRKQSTHSTGEVKFSRENSYFEDVQIPVGTLCTSSKDTSIMFETTQPAKILSNETLVYVTVRSTKTGAKTSIAAGGIDTIVTSIPGITKVENIDKISGGCDVESDQMYRARILENLKNINNGLNLKFYENVARSHKQVWFANAVYSPTEQTVNVYVDNYSRNLNNDTIKEVQALIDASREVNMNVVVLKATPKALSIKVKIYIENMADAQNCISKCTQVSQEYISSLGIGQKFTLSGLTRALLEVDEIKDCKFFVPTDNISVLSSEILVLSEYEFVPARYV